MKWYNKYMDYKEHIEHAIEYIEVNLTTELSLVDLAKVSGYSELQEGGYF